ncbi:MAG: hypothetical protein AAFQ98_01220 [Bacteroidota bacterium]
MQRNFTIALAVGLLCVSLIPETYAQPGRSRGRGRNSTIVAEPLRDDPNNIHKLYLGFMPVYSDMFVSNVTWGAGADAMIYPKTELGQKKYSIHLHGRTTYAPQTDLNRFVHNANISTDDEFGFNSLAWYTYVEAGGEYFFFDDQGVTDIYKLPVQRKKWESAEWEATVTEHFEFEGKKRTLVGARFGAIGYRSAVNIGNIAVRDSIEISGNFTQEDGSVVNMRYDSVRRLAETMEIQDLAFSNVSVGALYAGVSMRWIWNLAAEPEGHAMAILDNLITGYADVIISPSAVFFSDILTFNGNYEVAGSSLNAGFQNIFGGRIGIDLAQNRSFGWGLNAEIGYRPGLATAGFYMMAGLRFPVLGTDLDYSRETILK